MIRLTFARLAVPLCLALLGRTALAQNDLKNIPDPDPEVERKSFQVADGFEVNLFASDPLIAKPIEMNFDPQGRLWIASSEVYPQIKPGQTADDKVLILEDKDGDGKADSTEIFARGLLIPTGVEPGDGGAYVANSTDLLHLKDTDGDGKADTRRVVLSGFGTEDTHHILHTLRWGHDGMLYFNQSIYIHSHIETPHGVKRLNGGGIWEFRPETMQLDVFVRGFVNTWGHHFDRFGQSFATDGAGGEGINYCLPGAYYTTAPDAVRIIKGLNPGSPKYCGLEIVSGRHLPDDWQGNAITNDFRANRVCRFVLSDDGAGFAAKEMPELIKTTHGAFRPIDVKMGPDGAIYIADWYNPIIQHGEVDFRDPRRDHTHGRIWRVTAKNRPILERPKLVGAPVETLLDSLKLPEEYTRRQAKRVLKEMGALAVLPALAAWVKGLDPKDADFEHNRLEGLWTYQTLDVPNAELLDATLSSPEFQVRAAATRVLGHWASRLSNPLDLLTRLVVDENPRVRLEAVRVLGHIPGTPSAAIAMRALDKPVDQYLDYALWLTARDLAPSWLPALQAGQFDFEGQASHLVFALNALGSPAVVKPLLDSLAAGRINDSQRDRVLALISNLGNDAELGAVLDIALKGDAADEARRAGVLDALASASKRRKIRPSGDLKRTLPLLDAKEERLQSAAARALGTWGVQEARPKLVALAGNADASEALRAAAVEGLAALGGAESQQTLVALTAPANPPGTRKAAVAALIPLDLNAAASQAVAVLASSASGDDPTGLLMDFLVRKGGPEALTDALKDKKLPPDLAKLAARAADGSGGKNPELVEAIRSAGGLAARLPIPTGKDREALLAEVASSGNPAHGEIIFRDKRQACLRCHAVAGAGGQVGPSLESIGASAPVDYLLDSLLEPDKAIKENYHSLVVATTDGQIYNGIKVRQNDTELVLRDAEDREIIIPIAEVEDQKNGGSLMPAGQTDALTRTELVDLVRFLSELGKIGPYSVSKAMLARRWQVLEPSADTAEELRHEGSVVIARDDPRLNWSPVYSAVNGRLPASDIPRVILNAGDSDVGVVRCQVAASGEGTVTLAIDGLADGLQFFVDGKTFLTAKTVPLALTPGTHTLTFIVPRDKLVDGLRCELTEDPASPVKARFVIGK